QTSIRRTAIQTVVVGLLSLLGTSAFSEELPRAALGSRAVRFSYEAKVTPPDGAAVVELWLPLPRDEDQVVLDLRLAGSGHPTVVRLDPSGDRVAYLRVDHPHGAVTMGESVGLVRRETTTTPAASHATPADIDPVAFPKDLTSSPFVLVNDEVRA